MDSLIAPLSRFLDFVSCRGQLPGMLCVGMNLYCAGAEAADCVVRLLRMTSRQAADG
jgi:hypothetical protein